MQFEESIKEFNGEQIFCRHLKPQNSQDPKCLVFVCHGFAVHIGRYEAIFNLFNNENIYVFGHDHVGHGRSSGYRIWFENYDAFCTHVKMHIEETAARFPGKKVFIYGHSMGGSIALTCLLRYPNLVNGVILEGAYLALPDYVPRWLIQFCTYIGHNWLLGLLPMPKSDHNNDVSRDRKATNNISQSADEDPLVCHSAPRARTVAALIDAMKEVLSNAKQFTVPMLVLHGDKDRKSPIAVAESFYKDVSSTDKTLQVFEGGHHILHLETCNGIKESFRKTVTEWIIARC